MQQNKTLKCLLCDFTTTSQISLSKHTSFHHKLKFPDYLIQIKYDGNHPLCQCGCGEPTKYSPGEADFHKCLHGHQSRLEGHWGDLKSEKRVNAIKKTRKEKFANGEYNHIKEALNNRPFESIGKNISKTKQENPYKFSEESKAKMSKSRTGLKRSDETKQKMSKSHSDNWDNGDIGKRKYKKSQLESIFSEILNELNLIPSQKQLYSKEIKAFYDFYFPKYNIVIETDGDFWHCNPNSEYSNPKFKCQFKNLERDKLKEHWLKENNYTLIRIWESEIKNDINGVKQKLKEIFNLL